MGTYLAWVVPVLSTFSGESSAEQVDDVVVHSDTLRLLRSF